MLIVEMANKEINRRLYWIYANYRDGGHIKIMLVVEIPKLKLNGGHIEFMLIIEMAKIEINRLLYWIYANCRDGQIRINWRPH